MKKLFRKLFPSKEMRAYNKMYHRHRKELVRHAKQTREWDYGWLHESVIMQIRHMYEYYTARNNVWQSDESLDLLKASLKRILDLNEELNHLWDNHEHKYIKNDDGSIAAIHVTADIETGCGMPADGRKVKGTIHWLSAAHALPISAILYDRLFTEENMNDLPEDKTYIDYLNPESAVRVDGAFVEPSLADAKPGDKFQFVRTGYFCLDSKNEGVFNRVVSLKGSFKA